MAKWTNMKSG